jgi:hypothetical protein
MASIALLLPPPAREGGEFFLVSFTPFPDGEAGEREQAGGWITMKVSPS